MQSASIVRSAQFSYVFSRGSFFLTLNKYFVLFSPCLSHLPRTHIIAPLVFRCKTTSTSPELRYNRLCYVCLDYF